MIGDICAEIKNYFTYSEDRHIGDFTIENGVLAPSLDFPTDYIRIVGSRLNDGVHKKNANGIFVLKDESFHGAVWIMSVPQDFENLVAEIEAWQDKYGEAIKSPYQSESFGGYSYSKANGNSSSGGSQSPSWTSQFSGSLKRYRRIREL